MLLIPEALVPSLISMTDAIALVERSFAAFDRGVARPYPKVRAPLRQFGAVFGVDSGFDASARVLGLKAVGCWPDNARVGLCDRQSTIALFDPQTGRPAALIGANYLTSVCTAASSALAMRYLARPDSTTLSVIGAGAQAIHQVRAALAVRPLARVVAWSRTPKRLQLFELQVNALDLPFSVADTAEKAVSAADILVTATPSTSPIVKLEWVLPGTHVSAIGADAVGKQELDPQLIGTARVVVDSVEQAITIGECQHAFNRGIVRREDLTQTLGGLVSGRLQGSRTREEITVFDSTGIALQDLAPAAEALARARQRGIGVEVAF